MTSPKAKAEIGLTLTILFFITFITGIILHLKSHEATTQLPPVLRISHWAAGFLMTAFALWHGIQFRKMLSAMKKKFLWFWGDTCLSVLFISLTFLSGLIKLLSPVHIPQLGLRHYWFGIIMSITTIVHLFRGIPGWNRLRKIK